MHLARALSIGLGAIVLAVGTLLLFFRGSSSEGMSAVSNHWMAQHRAGQLDDLSR